MSDEKLDKLKKWGIVIVCSIIVACILHMPYDMYLLDYEEIQFLSHSDDSEHAEIKALLKEELERRTLLEIRKITFKLDVLDYEKPYYTVRVYFCTEDYISYSKLYLDCFLSQEIRELMDELILGT